MSELASILDWVKSLILVTLYQQQRDNRVMEGLCGETPLQSRRERARARNNSADSLGEMRGGRSMQGLGPLQAIAGILLRLYYFI